jgi:chemotaxis protein CheD
MTLRTKLHSKADKLSLPAAIAGFDHINRYWDPVNEVHAAKLLPGEYYVTTSGEMITTVLGSCISACIRDRVLGIGGMNHFMLPGDSQSENHQWGSCDVSAGTRYGNNAMERLINDILKQGGRRENLDVKIFGGGQVLKIGMNIGLRNTEFARHYAECEKLPLLAEDTGGPYPRKVIYYPETGKVRIKKLGAMGNGTLSTREEQYFHEIAKRPVKAEVELF